MTDVFDLLKKMGSCGIGSVLSLAWTGSFASATDLARPRKWRSDGQEALQTGMSPRRGQSLVEAPGISRS
jgi:hypothetical protein